MDYSATNVDSMIARLIIRNTNRIRRRSNVNFFTSRGKMHVMSKESRQSYSDRNNTELCGNV